MSVQSDTSSISYVGNASTVTPYAVPFYFFQDEDLIVKVVDQDGIEETLVLNTDYTVSGAGVESGGSVVTGGGAIPVTSTVTIYRELDATQPTVFTENAAFPAAEQERGLDRATMLVQQALRGVAQSFRFRVSDGAAAEVEKIVDSLFGLNVSGTPLFRTRDEVITWLSLPAPILNFPTKTWQDASERALAVPDFVGQLGTQKDNSSAWISTALTAGSWTAFSSTPADGTVTTAKLAAALDFSGKTLTWGALQIPDSALAALAWSKLTGIPASSGDLSGTYPALTLPAGAVLKTLQTSYVTSADISALVPIDDTKPTSGEGTQIISRAITPASASNTVLVRFQGQVQSSGTGDYVVISVFRGTTNIGTAYQNTSFGDTASLTIEVIDSPASASAQTYTVRVGVGTLPARLNGSFSARLFGGAIAATLTVQEIKG